MSLIFPDFSPHIVKTDVQQRLNHGTSLMPEGLEKPFSRESLFDLLTYLLSLK